MSKGVYPRNGGYQCKVMLGGNRYTGQFTTEAEAAAARAKAIADFKLGRPISLGEEGTTATAGVRTIEDLVAYCCKHKWAKGKCATKYPKAGGAHLAQLFADHVGPKLTVA